MVFRVHCSYAVTALAVNHLLPYYLSVGCADSTVRTYDRRMLTTRALGLQSLCFAVLSINDLLFDQEMKEMIARSLWSLSSKYPNLRIRTIESLLCVIVRTLKKY